MVKLWRVLPREIWLIGWVCFSLPALVFGQNEAPAKPEPGLRVTFTSLEGDKQQATDTTTLPNLWLYVPFGQPPTPFMPGGRFSAVWEGFISVDLRGDYLFELELNGQLKLEINGKLVKDANFQGIGRPTPPTDPVRLNKGTNSFRAYFASPARGDGYVQLLWYNKEIARGPVPMSALTHVTTPELQKADRLRLGRELLMEYRCVKCHAVPSPGTGMPELAMDAPTFDGIGSRRNFDWMARWILDPQAQRAIAHMPRLLHGAKAKEDAESIATFLASLNEEATPKQPAIKEAASDQIELGQKLFETLHCVACHNAPDGTETAENKISLKHVRGKFASGTLPAFLQKPAAHYAWTRMPHFKLSDDETAQLAAYLDAKADKPGEVSTPQDKAIIERGKKLVQTTGCLNCHSAKLANQFSARPLTDLAPDKWTQGCLAASPSEASKAPQFAFSAAEREALQAFASTDRTSLSRHVLAEFAERQIRLLNCKECHGKFDGFPQLDILGEKLKPEWAKAFIAGEISYKPRPWLDARMPAFPQRAEALAQGMAMQHGYPPQAFGERPIDAAAAKVGQKLVSTEGGFSCISCHAVGEVGATQVFEAPGPNFAHSGERLLKPYFQRWLRSPLQVDPNTKMPVYFDEEGKSPLSDIFNGDGAKQINAIWEYIRQGDKMPPPGTQ